MKKPKKRSVLFIGQMPPPWHGVSAINSWILESKQLNKFFTFHPVNLTTATSITDIGKQSISKYILFIKAVLITFYKLISLNPSLCYITLTPTGSAFFKDSIILLILKLFKKNILVHFHGKGITAWVKSKPIWVKSYYKKVLDGTSLIVLGKNLLNDVEIVYDKQPYVVPNGIPIISSQEGDYMEKPMFEILFLSNLMKAKGVIDFVDSLVLLTKANDKFNATIIGDSGDVSIAQIKNKLFANNLQDHLKIIGPKYGAEKFQYLLQADVLVFPTHNDAFGLVLLEAMQVGLPVITTNEGCIPEIIEHNVNGYIVDKKSPQSIANKLVYLINNPCTKNEIGERNKAKFKEEYTLDIFEKRMIKILNQMNS